MKFAILCPTLTEGATVHRPGTMRIGNAFLRNRMMSALTEQILVVNKDHEVRIFFNEDAGQKTTGAKRNELVAAAVEWGSDAHAHFDDDDLPGDTYIQRAIEFMESGMDVAELWGQIYFNGKAGNPFHHYIECLNPATGKIEWWQDDNFYYRMPNHLNFVRTELVKDIKFPDQVFGEDGKHSHAVQEAGVLKTEFKIPEIIYHYFCGDPKRAL
jgi:hypothetical protein